MFARRFILGVAILVIVASTAQADGADYLLRILGGEKGTPPSALELPGFKPSIKGPKKGLGPVLHRAVTEDPVFHQAYCEFLRWLDEVNGRLAQAGGGTFRMQAVMRGAEDFARAIELMGGSASCDIKANDLGITWDTMMTRARVFADRALGQSDLDLSADERVFLANMFALGSITAAANRVLPDDYLAEWEARHPDRPQPPLEPQGGIKKMIWEGVRLQIPWMYHAGSMPWLDPTTTDAHDYYDTFHFFSHAWMSHFNLYRHRYFKKGLFSSGYAPAPITWGRIRGQLWYSNFIGFGYEVMTTALASGLADMTPTDELPPVLQKVARFLHLGSLPIVEAIRDTRINHDGAEFGAALAVTSLALEPSQFDYHDQLLRQFKKGLLADE